MLLASPHSTPVRDSISGLTVGLSQLSPPLSTSKSLFAYRWAEWETSLRGNPGCSFVAPSGSSSDVALTRSRTPPLVTWSMSVVSAAGSENRCWLVVTCTFPSEPKLW
jgi:hypothetical protein